MCWLWKGPVRIVQRPAQGAAAGDNLFHGHSDKLIFSQSLASGNVAKSEDDPGLGFWGFFGSRH